MTAVCAVVVTYRPEPAALARLLRSVAPQVTKVVVVDNGSPDDIAALARGHDFIGLADNLGLAAGLNRGIVRAREAGASHVILFDQDSDPAPDMVAALLAGERRLRALGRPVAAVGPRFVDVKTGRRDAVIVPARCYWSRRDAPQFEAFIEAGYLISSGQLISVAALDAVGPMRADLFIDYIDIEWCLRARARGLRVYTVDGATMAHDLGDTAVRLGQATKMLHTPLRHYYIVRNALLLLRTPSIPRAWKAGDALKTLRRIVAFPLLSRKPLQECRWLIRAVGDGLRGKAGKATYKDGGVR
jgi:rhamnosyltransferase